MGNKTLVAVTIVSVMALVLAACAAPTPEVVEVEKTIEVPVEVTKLVHVEVTPIPEGPYKYLARAKTGEFAGSKVKIFGVYTGEDANRFSAALVPFEQATGIDVEFEGSADFETLITVRVEGGDAPDIAQFSQPGLMSQFTDQLVPLDSFMNMDQLKED